MRNHVHPQKVVPRVIFRRWKKVASLVKPYMKLKCTTSRTTFFLAYLENPIGSGKRPANLPALPNPETGIPTPAWPLVQSPPWHLEVSVCTSRVGCPKQPHNRQYSGKNSYRKSTYRSLSIENSTHAPCISGCRTSKHIRTHANRPMHSLPLDLLTSKTWPIKPPIFFTVETVMLNGGSPCIWTQNTPLDNGNPQDPSAHNSSTTNTEELWKYL